ncbi:hypothetical protein D3C79_1074020 [compost metagenome]
MFTLMVPAFLALLGVLSSLNAWPTISIRPGDFSVCRPCGKRFLVPRLSIAPMTLCACVDSRKVRLLCYGGIG